MGEAPRACSARVRAGAGGAHYAPARRHHRAPRPALRNDSADLHTTQLRLAAPRRRRRRCARHLHPAADHADVLVPATTQLEHDDLHKAYGHLYMMYSKRAIDPLGEALPNSEIFRRLAAAMHLDFPELKATDEELMRDALSGTAESMRGITLEELRERGSIRLNVPTPHLPFRSGAKLST